MPDWARALRPEWTLLVLLFWALECPLQVGVGFAFVAGLCLDVLHGSSTPLGANGLAMMVPVFFAHRISRRAQQFTLWQIMLFIFTMLALCELIQLWIDGTAGNAMQWNYRLWPVVTGTLLWPTIQVVLHDVRLRFRID